MALEPVHRRDPFADTRLSPYFCRTGSNDVARQLDRGDPVYKHYKLRSDICDICFERFSKEIVQFKYSYGYYSRCVSVLWDGVWARIGWCCERYNYLASLLFSSYVRPCISLFRDSDYEIKRCNPGLGGVGWNIAIGANVMATTLFSAFGGAARCLHFLI